MIRIKVPATSANLGSGFDALGLALDLYNVFSFKAGAGSIDEDSLVHLAYNKVFTYLHREIEPVEIIVDTNIPMARGLGSSASCIVGGIMGANEVLGGVLSQKEILTLATEIEGHPDNVAPAIFGGMVVSVMEDNEIYWANIPVKNDYNYIVLIPDFELSTKEARRVLPEMIPFDEAKFNVGRVSLLITAMVTGQDDLIKIGLEDKLHEPYRGDLIPGFRNIMDKVRSFNLVGSYLSGAGPSIMIMAKKDDQDGIKKIKDFMEKSYPDWLIFEHHLENIGAMRID